MSPIIGVVLMVMITLLISSIFAAQASMFAASLDEKEQLFDEQVTTLSGNPWSGSRGDLVRLSNNKAGATDVTYRVNFTINPGSDAVGDSLDSIYLEVTTGSPDMFSNTELADLELAGIDGGSDGTIDLYITSDANGWNVRNGGTALEIAFGTNYSNRANDSVILVFEGVDNPKNAGTYDLYAETSDGDGNRHNGTITIVD